MEYHWPLAAVGSLAGSALLFFGSRFVSPLVFVAYRSLNTRDRRNWDGRYHSTVHAALVTLLAFAAIQQYNSQKVFGLLDFHSQLTDACLGISLGYFAVDTVLLFKYFPILGDSFMMIHHAMALVSLVSVLRLRQCHIYSLFCLMSECTTPSINLRWTLDKAGMRDSKMYVYNGLLLMLSWFIVRIVGFALLFKSLWDNSQDVMMLAMYPRIAVVVMPALLSVLNVFWFTKILKGGLKVLFGTKQTKEM